MFGTSATRQERREQPDDLFTRIGVLLCAQGLSPDPANYAFAHHLLTRDDPEAAAIVRGILADGVRLTRRDIDGLGGRVTVGAPVTAPAAADRCEDAEAERLIAQTCVQADAVATIVRAMHDETRDFGRGLAESAAAFAGDHAAVAPDEVVRLTKAMIDRAASAEERLASATREADALRVELAEAQASARCDPLTGLPNRRAFDEAFATIDPAVEHCLAVCDIDRFKRVNDDFGHAVGDRVLSALARLLTDHCHGHLVTRQGGEEFAVLLSGVALTEATRLLDGARAAAAARRLRDRDSDAPIGQVTFSAGIVAVAPGEDRDDALARADRLLYRAKAAGRDRVVAG